MMETTRIVLLLISVCCSTTKGQRCNAPTFSCQYNNPCDPLCFPGQHLYTGSSSRKYVECDDRECTEQMCPRRSNWNQANLRCEGSNEMEARCAFGKFDCESRNPCSPTLCESGIEKYPGPSPRWYVSCTDGCSSEQCPRRQVWDQEKQRCVRKRTLCSEGQTYDEDTSQCVDSGEPVCSWQEIPVLTPSVDCTNDYTFYQHKYVDQERGYRHLDGFVDCTTALSGNTYYVEEKDVPNVFLVSCHPTDGLCFNLTSGWYEGGWVYFVTSIPGVDAELAPNFSFFDMENEVHASCVVMDYFAEPAGTDEDYTQEAVNACYIKEGRLLYRRRMTYYGSCSDKIPCSVTSNDNTIIYEYVCE